MSERVDRDAFEYAMGQIDDGFLFESFAQEFLTVILGHTFIPAGGIHDRGIDGLQHFFHHNKYDRQIYQISIEKPPTTKLSDTIAKLIANNIVFDSLVFVTNQEFKNQDIFLDKVINETKKNIRIYDSKWFSVNVNSSPATVNLYNSFIQKYLHEYNQPGKSFHVTDLEADPRLFVFLRQQWEEKRYDLAIDEIIADTLILYSLEGTDPENGIVKTKDQIKIEIGKLIKFDPKQIYGTIDKRLTMLSKKPRKIKFDSRFSGYCLPYETRLAIQEKNILDLALFENFISSACQMFETHLAKQKVIISNPTVLIEQIINKLYYQQGLEFSNFVLNGENVNAIEKNLPDIINQVVAQSSVTPSSRTKVETALLLSVRDIVYRGNEIQKKYLSKLSSTYMLLFMLQCDPKLATYFSSLASKLEIYVCTSIIIPALSEYHLEPENRRHWNLLKGAYAAGVTLIIDEHTIDELVSHLWSIKNIYEKIYKHEEEVYLDEIQTLYIDEILIRAYFYARISGVIDNFNNFLDCFVNPDLSNAEESLIVWLHSEFGIQYKTNKELNIQIDKDEEELLLRKLTPLKKNIISKARNDVRTILKVYALRNKNSETSSSGIFGYRTWWLSKDTTTYKVVNATLGDKYKVSCYMRPDFLYNYIVLGPNKQDVDHVYSELFPSLIGANISFHLPQGLLDYIHSRISEHKQINPSRKKAILKELAEKLKYDPSYQTRNFVKHYLDEKLEKFNGIQG